MKTSPVLVAALSFLASACSAASHSSATSSTRPTTTTIPAVDAPIVAAFKSATDVSYELGSQPAVAGDSQAAIALGLSPQLSAVFADPAYTQVRLGITNSHLNGVQGPATYTLAKTRVVSVTPATNPTQATVYACLFDTGDFNSATHQPVTQPAGSGAGWAYGIWTLVNQGGTWKVSDFHFDITPTTDGEHPTCKNEPSPSPS